MGIWSSYSQQYTMAVQKTGFILITLCICVNCQPPGLQKFTSNTACHGTANLTVNYMNITCPAAHVIAVSNVQLGANLLADNCPLFYNSLLNFDTCCTNKSGTDCLFPFNSNSVYQELCNGQQSCGPSTQHQEIHTSCNASYGTIDGNFSSYMFAEYYCVEDTKIVDMCIRGSKTQENTQLYLWNQGFPRPVNLSNTECACTIEIDNCQATINIYTMYKKLTGDSVDECNQNITIKDGHNNTLITWSCTDNALTIDTVTVNATYIRVELSNDRNASDGKFWLGFGASNASNITISCPAAAQQNCILPSKTVITPTTTYQTTSTTRTTEPSTTITPSTVSATNTSTSTEHSSTTSVSSNSSKEDRLMIAVIVLGILVGLLAIAVIVLACLLYRGRKRNLEDKKVARSVEEILIPAMTDPFEKQIWKNETSEIINSKPPLSALPTTKLERKTAECQTDELKTILRVSDFKCQVDLPVLNVNTHDSSSQTNPPVVVQWLDFSCQVHTVKVETLEKAINTDQLFRPNEAIAHTIDTECSTRQPFISSEEMATQTLKIKMKNKKIQSEQTVEIETPYKPLTTENENLDTSQDGLHSLVGQTEVNNVLIYPEPDLLVRSEQTSVVEKKKKRRRKYDKQLSDQFLVVDGSDIEDLDVHSVRFDFPKSPPAFTRFKRAKDSQDLLLSEATDLDDTGSSSNSSKIIHVVPKSTQDVQSKTDEDTPYVVKRTTKIQKVIVNSFFTPERENERMIKLLHRRSRKKRKF